jgi:hypothetical protein
MKTLKRIEMTRGVPKAVTICLLLLLFLFLTLPTSAIASEGTTSTYELGDVDLNGKVNSLDLLELRKIVAGYVSPAEEQKAVANIDGDAQGKINTLDILRLRQYLAGYLATL